MNKRRGILRGGTRAAIGVALTVAGALLVANLSLIEVPEVTRSIPVVTVDTEQDARRTIVCQGPFGQLGADAESPDRVLPLGTAEMQVSLAPDATDELDPGVETGQAPVAHRSGESPIISAAQVQRLDTESIKGLAANSCLEPSNDQWIVGTSTVRGMSSTLTLTNPGAVPATAQVTLYDETGEIESIGATGLLVPAGAARSVSLNGYGAGLESIAVHVVSAGSAVVAVVGASEIRDITPVGADHITAQTGPETELTFPGVVNYVDHMHVDEGEEHEDEFPVVVRLIAPGNDGGSAQVYALSADGERELIADASVAAGAITDTTVHHYPEDATGIVVTSTVPVVGGVMSSVHADNSHDFTWHSPAPMFGAGEVGAAVRLSGGKLVVVNHGSEEATVEISEPVAPAEAADAADAADGDGAGGGDGDGAEGDDADGDDAGSDDADASADSASDVPEPRVVTIAPGAAQEVSAPANSRITSDQPFSAAVSIFAGDQLTSYPIVPAIERFTKIRVYPR